MAGGRVPGQGGVRYIQGSKDLRAGIPTLSAIMPGRRGKPALRAGNRGPIRDSAQPLTCPAPCLCKAIGTGSTRRSVDHPARAHRRDRRGRAQRDRDPRLGAGDRPDSVRRPARAASTRGSPGRWGAWPGRVRQGGEEVCASTRGAPRSGRRRSGGPAGRLASSVSPAVAKQAQEAPGIPHRSTATGL